MKFGFFYGEAGAASKGSSTDASKSKSPRKAKEARGVDIRPPVTEAARPSGAEAATIKEKEREMERMREEEKKKKALEAKLREEEEKRKREASRAVTAAPSSPHVGPIGTGPPIAAAPISMVPPAGSAEEQRKRKAQDPAEGSKEKGKQVRVESPTPPPSQVTPPPARGPATEAARPTGRSGQPPIFSRTYPGDPVFHPDLVVRDLPSDFAERLAQLPERFQLMGQAMYSQLSKAEYDKLEAMPRLEKARLRVANSLKDFVLSVDAFDESVRLEEAEKRIAIMGERQKKLAEDGLGLVRRLQDENRSLRASLEAEKINCRSSLEGYKAERAKVQTLAKQVEELKPRAAEAEGLKRKAAAVEDELVRVREMLKKAYNDKGASDNAVSRLRNDCLRLEERMKDALSDMRKAQEEKAGIESSFWELQARFDEATRAPANLDEVTPELRKKIFAGATIEDAQVFGRSHCEGYQHIVEDTCRTFIARVREVYPDFDAEKVFGSGAPSSAEPDIEVSSDGSDSVVVLDAEGQPAEPEEALKDVAGSGDVSAQIVSIEQPQSQAKEPEPTVVEEPKPEQPSASQPAVGQPRPEEQKDDQPQPEEAPAEKPVEVLKSS